MYSELYWEECNLNSGVAKSGAARRDDWHIARCTCGDRALPPCTPQRMCQRRGAASAGLRGVFRPGASRVWAAAPGHQK